jgi:hypothetical protein
MTDMTDEDVIAVIKLRNNMGAACEGFTVGQVIHALVVLTTDVFVQAADDTPQFIANVTEFTCDIVKLHATYFAHKDSGADDNSFSVKVH